jgi:hypothetical protein
MAAGAIDLLPFSGIIACTGLELCTGRRVGARAGGARRGGRGSDGIAGARGAFSAPSRPACHRGAMSPAQLYTGPWGYAIQVSLELEEASQILVQ